MSSPRDVVITGLGVVCPLGIGGDALWEGLEQGRSGVVEIPEYVGSGLPYRVAGIIQGFEAKDFVQPRKTIKVMCREIQVAYAAAALAASDAGLTKGAIEPERFGVVLGSEILFGEIAELADVYRHSIVDGQLQMDRYAESAFKDLFPLWMLKYLPNMAACHISIVHDARGPNNSIIQGDASSLLAVMEASMVIQRGHADAMLAGGSGSNGGTHCLPFRGHRHLTTWPGDPAGASRPFDARRSGMVPGEGAGVMVLETRESAQRRGAKILARVLGFASRFEMPRAGQPMQGTAIRGSIQAALAAAGLGAGDIGHVNAHGDSRIEQDRLEAQAIAATLGDVPVTAIKSYFGNLSVGSGAIEMIASVLALVHGRVPPTLNYETPDPACPIRVIHGQPLTGGKPTALLLNQSSTGQAAAVVIARD